MKAFAAAALGLVLSAQAALASEPVYPPASRIGIVPPTDMMVSKRFRGFESEEKGGENTVSMAAAIPPDVDQGAAVCHHEYYGNAATVPRERRQVQKVIP